jgi:hypothetical protein
MSYYYKFTPSDAVGRGEDVVRVDEGAAAVELSVVHEPSHPRVPVDSSHLSAHDSRLLVDHTAICEIMQLIDIFTQLAIR